MKKIIRLTESELNRIIKKVISEAPLSTYTPPDLAAAAAANAPKAASIPTNISTEKRPVPKTIFGIGDKGPEILAFQKHLVALGDNVGKKGADGVFGPATEAAVKSFQAKYGIKVSGRVGPPTKGKLAMVASAPKPTYDPNAEWNQDRREDGNPPASTTQATPTTASTAEPIPASTLPRSMQYRGKPKMPKDLNADKNLERIANRGPNLGQRLRSKPV
jgi:peptidoglycan hydrolase-like protein with peptidoglycan-binding domain